MTPGWLQDDPGRRFRHLVYLARLFVWADRTGHPGARDHYLDLWLRSQTEWEPSRYAEREALEGRGGLGTTTTAGYKPQYEVVSDPFPHGRA